MIELIKEGKIPEWKLQQEKRKFKISKPPKRYEFFCITCDCRWYADLKEDCKKRKRWSTNLNHPGYKDCFFCKCPKCGKETYYEHIPELMVSFDNGKTWSRDTTYDDWRD